LFIISQIVESNCFKTEESLNGFLSCFKLITGSQIFTEEKLANSLRDSHAVSQAEKLSKVLFPSFHHNHSLSLVFSKAYIFPLEKLFIEFSLAKGSL
jgi:hypothetical protein